jgi:hypothetical protein
LKARSFVNSYEGAKPLAITPRLLFFEQVLILGPTGSVQYLAKKIKTDI